MQKKCTSEGNRIVIFSMCLGFLALLSTIPCFGQEKEKVSKKDLQQIVDLMEDPQKREALIKDLKNLIRAQEVATKEGEKQMEKPPEKKKREVLFVETIFVRFEALSRKVLGSAVSAVVSLVARTPQAFGKVKSFFSRPENRSKFLSLLGNTAAGILIALIVGLLLRRHLPSMPERGRNIIHRLSKGLVRVFMGVAPYGATLVALLVLFGMFPTFPKGNSLALLFFMVLFFYRIAVEVFRVLLSPDEESVRMLPLGDENANHLWIWMLRFANYTALYLLVIKGLFIAEVAPASLVFIRGILLIVFPLMISVFITQVAREIRVKRESLRKNRETQMDESKKMASFLFHYWPLLAIAYAWAIFLFLIAQYNRGFRYLFLATLGSAVTILAILLAQRLVDWLFKRFFAISEIVKARFPGLEEKTNRYIRIIRRAVGAIVVIIGLGVIAQIWGLPVSAFIASGAGALIIVRTIAIVITRQA